MLEDLWKFGDSWSAGRSMEVWRLLNAGRSMEVWRLLKCWQIYGSLETPEVLADLWKFGDSWSTGRSMEVWRLLKCWQIYGSLETPECWKIYGSLETPEVLADLWKFGDSWMLADLWKFGDSWSAGRSMEVWRLLKCWQIYGSLETPECWQIYGSNCSLIDWNCYIFFILTQHSVSLCAWTTETPSPHMVSSLLLHNNCHWLSDGRDKIVVGVCPQCHWLPGHWTLLLIVHSNLCLTCNSFPSS